MYFVQVDKLCVWTIYDEVEAKGVDFTGKVVLTRYNQLFRGQKVSFDLRGLI